MKTLSLFVLAFAALTTVAHADFIAGRVRAHYKSAMHTTAANGIFAGVSGAQVSVNIADGDADPTSFTVTLSGESESHTFFLKRSQRTACGNLYFGETIENSTVHYSMEFIAPPSAACEQGERPNNASAKIFATNPVGAASEIDFEGKLQALILTL